MAEHRGRAAARERTGRRDAEPTEHPRRLPSSRFASSPYVILAVILAAGLVVRLGTLRRVQLPSGQVVYHHLESDELVFQTLIEQVGKGFDHYTLRGTSLLQHLDPQNYDLPLFFHPPGFVYAARLLSFMPLPLVPVLMNLATVGLVFFIGRRLYDERRAVWAALLVAACPVMCFVSQKIWIDNMVILMVTANVAALVWAADRGRVWTYAVAGAVFGLAFLSKAIAPVIVLALVPLALQRDRTGDLAKKAAAFLVPAAVPIVWWEATLHAHNGEWLPSAFPNPDMKANFPFVADAVGRPWYFYLVTLAAISPVYLLALLALRHWEPRHLAPVIWAATFLVVMTGFGLRGGGYQTRYVAPAYPALALLAAVPIPKLRLLGAIGVVLLVGYGMMNAVLYAVLDTPRLADFETSAFGVLTRALSDVPKMP